VPEWCTPAWHLYVVMTPERDRLQRALRESGIDTLIHYPHPPHQQRAYADTSLAAASFPISEKMHREVLSLPIGPHMPREQQERVVEATLEHAATLNGRTGR